jgi:phage I-like protein
MSVTITIQDPLAIQIQNEARARKRPLEEVVNSLLTQALAEKSQADAFTLTPEEVVAKIQALPPNPSAFRPATGSLAEILAASIAAEPKDEPFDQEAWDRQWDAIEAEMKALDQRKSLERMNDIIEGLTWNGELPA